MQTYYSCTGWFYDGSGVASFADQARQIEIYSQKLWWKVHGAYGASQGGLVTELLRNKVNLGTVLIVRCYVAHQGSCLVKFLHGCLRN